MHKKLTFLLFIFLLFCLLTGKAFAATYTVTNCADSGAGSLRQAITDANGNSGTDIIEFQIPTSEATSGSGVYWWKIELLSSFPSISDTVHIDGTTQATMTDEAVPGNPDGPEIEITTSSPESVFISVFNLGAGASDSTIESLAINNFRHPLSSAIYLIGGNDCRIYNCYIGTDVKGQTARGNSTGIALTSGSSSNLIGSTEGSRRNVISGNTYGIYMDGSNVTSNEVLGNFIGTDKDGLFYKSNTWGVVISGEAQYNRIGDGFPAGRNLISKSLQDGVTIKGPNTNYNQVSGNYIGLNVNGNGTGIGNTGNGAIITEGAQYNKIQANFIANNKVNGIYISMNNTNSNEVLGNTIGLMAYNFNLDGNYDNGVLIDAGARYNKIGNGTEAGRNIISGNVESGIRIEGTDTDSNEVLGNIIGLAPDGVTEKGNNQEGVYIDSGPRYNKIGDGTPSGRNIISDNSNRGVLIRGSHSAPEYITKYNQVLGNFIGTDISGTLEKGNGEAGVYVYFAASLNRVEGNVISGNGTYGVHLDSWWQEPFEKGVSSNEVYGNLIGTTSNGAQALPNFSDGVRIENKANYNLIGGTAEGQGNTISGNNDNGIMIEGCSTNEVLGNYIGTTSNGAAALPNSKNGVQIHGSGHILIGWNIISGNSEKGVFIDGCGGNQVLGNFIGTDATGTQPVGNTWEAVAIIGGGVYSAGNNLIGDGTPGGRNIISGNHWRGILISGEGASGNQIHGNFIGTDVTGAASLENEGMGVRIEGVGTLNYNTIRENVISGNRDGAIEIVASNANSVLGNLIGTTSDGASALGNGKTAVLISNGAQYNHIGDGLFSESRNIICAADWYGVRIRGTGTNSNEVMGNYIGGVSEEGFGNAWGGVVISEGASYNKVGAGWSSFSRNIIVGNGWPGPFYYGVMMYDLNTNHNQVEGNYIGVDEDGATPLPNNGVGVGIWDGASYNTIGDGDQVISANTGGGISIHGSDGKICEHNLILENIIGTDKDESIPLGNGDSSGIEISQYTRYTSIGDGAGGGSVICAHQDGRGIKIDGATSVEVYGNCIGWVDSPWDISDTYENNTFANSEEGIAVSGGSSFITIGGHDDDEGNLILGNQENGISISENSQYVRLAGNTIHGNRGFGVEVDEGSQHNQITSNYIIFNGWGGVFFFMGAGTNEVGPGNYIIGNGTGEAVDEFREITYFYLGATLEPAGVMVTNQSSAPIDNITKRNTITRNTIYENLGLGIHLFNNGNDGMAAPTIESLALTGTGTAFVSGIAIPNSTVEVFQANGLDPFGLIPWVNPDPSGAGEGLTYLGSTIAGPTGSWSIGNLPVSGDPVISATATDTIGNTSMFSQNKWIVTDTETPEVLAVYKPLGGDTWYVDAKQDIAWAVLDINEPMAEHNIYLSRDEGPYQKLTVDPNDIQIERKDQVGQGKWVYRYFYNWEVPPPPCIAKIKVEVIDYGGNRGVGEGNLFRIESVPPFINITDPAKGDRIKGGQEYTVLYQTSYGLVEPIYVHYSIDGGQNWPEASPDRESVDYSYTWNVPGSSTLPYSDNCYLRMVSTLDAYGRENIIGQSEKFTIDNQPPSVIVSETTPLIGATAVPQNESIKVVFSEPMNTYSVEQAFSLKLKYPPAGTIATPVSGNYDWSEDKTTLYFTAFLGMDLDKEYVYNIADTAADSVGNTLTDPFSASFITTDVPVGDVAPDIGGIFADGVEKGENDPIDPTPLIEARITDNRIYPFGITLFIDELKKTYHDFEYVKEIPGKKIYIKYQVPKDESLEKVPAKHRIKVEARDAAGYVAEKEITGLYYDPKLRAYNIITYPSDTGTGAAGASFSPAAGETITIAYQLTTNAPLAFYCYSPAGEVVWTKKFVEGEPGARTGYNTVTFDGRSDITGAPLGNGIYPLQITSGGEVIGKTYIVVFHKVRP